MAKSGRRQEILRELAAMLQANPGGRITTAALAQQVGVSEAALYRHFPSKAKMFEALIEFIEETLFSRISKIMNEEQTADNRCEKLLRLILTFCELNPGITRILTGDPLAGETERLRERVDRLFDRIETQLRQILREMAIREERETSIDPTAGANLLLSLAEGRIGQYVRSDFSRKPTEHWDVQWLTVKRGLF